MSKGVIYACDDEHNGTRAQWCFKATKGVFWRSEKRMTKVSWYDKVDNKRSNGDRYRSRSKIEDEME